MSARGCKLIVPVGLEKLIPSVPEAARLCGQGTFYYSQGTRVGIIPLVNAKVVTEIQAFRILFGLEAHHVGGGGVNGSEGSVVIVAEREKEGLDRAIRLIESIKGEPPLRPKKSLCLNCLPTTPSKLAKPEEQFPDLVIYHRMFRGRRNSRHICNKGLRRAADQNIEGIR